ncbi:MAG: serine/threonine-protein kinase, partial [Planctomycetota bacterium]
MAGGVGILGVLVVLFGVAVAIIVLVLCIPPFFRLLGWIFKAIGAVFVHIGRFVGGMFGDTLRAIGAVLTALVFVPLVVLNIVIGRWSASAHFGRALKREISVLGHCTYRVFVGHPARFLLLDSVLEGIEQRVPEAIARAPGSDTPSRRTGKFPGYEIIGSLKGGGSGGRLYVADPDEMKRAAFARTGADDVAQVVIKSFSVHDGSSLPQIIRESRALEAARKLNLILDHELTEERFFYVMPYVPGEDLSTVTTKLHADAGSGGLDDFRLREGLGYVCDLLETLQRYHSGGLWHKDIKPDNIIVSHNAAHLVDLGLVTPLRSAMTLTTHGTEYFRDPEMVRLALRGVKVHEVDGVKFDIYGAGAVLFSVVENSFPAHGGLSQLTRRCPEAIRWIIRRSMTDLNKRY